MDKTIRKFKDNLIYILYWPAFILAFIGVEKMEFGRLHEVHFFLDDMIPFNELFVIPYFFWHPLIVIVLLYTLINETDNFRNLMKFFILTFTVSLIIYLIYPTSLDIRPHDFERDNICTMIAQLLYSVDNPVNVCPSMHIIGCLGMLFASWDTRGKDSVPKKVFMAVAFVFICASTLIVKQHSVIDVLAAIPISLIGWVLCFRGKEIENIKIPV